MKKLNNKGFTLVELLAVIVVLAIVMGLAVVAITGVLDNARKATFVADAKSFLEGARNIVTSEEMNSLLDGSTTGHSYAVACDSSTIPTSTEIPISAIKTQQGGEKSPYGNNYDKTNSKIYVSASKDDTDCKYTYKIYLTDGVYAIGGSGADNAIEWTTLSTATVNPVSAANNG